MRVLVRMRSAAVALAGGVAALVTASLVSAAGGAPAGYIPSKVNCHIDVEAPNVNLDCPNQQFPVGEPHVAVDPRGACSSSHRCGPASEGCSMNF